MMYDGCINCLLSEDTYTGEDNTNSMGELYPKLSGTRSGNLTWISSHVMIIMENSTRYKMLIYGPMEVTSYRRSQTLIKIWQTQRHKVHKIYTSSMNSLL